MKKLLYLLFFVIFTSIPLVVHGAGIVATVSKEEHIVQAGDEAFFSIRLKNNQIREDSFKLEVDDFAIVPFSDVVERVTFEPSSTVKVLPGQDKQVQARVKFLETAKTEKNYVTEIKIKSTSNPAVYTKVGLSTYLISPRNVVDVDIKMPEILIPGRSETLNIKLKNNANVALDDLDIFYTSSIFNYEDKISLEALEEKETSIEATIDPLTEQGEYTLTARIFDNGKIKGSKNAKFNVGPNPDLKEVEETKKQFLRYTVKIVRENEGNTNVIKTVKYPVSYLQTLFTKVSPEGELIIKDDQRIYQWSFDIPPGDIYRIEIITDYRPLFFSIVGILILFGVFFYFRKKDIKVKKSVFKIHESKEEEGIAELKILLHIKNKSHRELYNVKVIDLFPRIVKPEMDFGTIKPSKIQEGSSGIRMIWELAKVDPGDEIVITYKIKTKLSLLGKLVLPPSAVQYYGRRKRIITIKSNRLVYRA